MRSIKRSASGNSDEESFNPGECGAIDSEEEEEWAKRNPNPRKNGGKRRRWGRMRKRTPFNESLWSVEENSIYRLFLIQRGWLFDSNRIQRKAIKINVQMSETIKTRSPDQCRSHHQKMMKHHQNIPNIILHLTSLIDSHTQPRSSNCESPTKGEVSLKDLSNFEITSEDQESIWNQLIQHPSITALVASEQC